MGDDQTQMAEGAHDDGRAETPDGSTTEDIAAQVAASDDSAVDGSPAGGVSEASTSADLAMMQRAKARHGVAGAIVAGGMLGLDKVLGRPAKEEIPVVWEASGEPLDIDNTGITVPVDSDREVYSNPGVAGRSDRRVVKRRR